MKSKRRAPHGKSASREPFESTPKPAIRQETKSFRPEPKGQSARTPDPGGDWIYGAHAVQAALTNVKRTARRLLALSQTQERWKAAAAKRSIPVEVVNDQALKRALGENAVHQGVALQVAPLPLADIEDLLDRPAGSRLAIVLDQVTDPHNVGAIIRSAAAFGASAVIVQDRHAPQMTGIVAKAASGALDVVSIVRVVNIARTLEELKDAGFTAIGLAEEGTTTLSKLKPTGDIVLALGAEGEGLRRLVRDTCDVLVRLPTDPALPSLNVSNAAAVALYELRRQ